MIHADDFLNLCVEYKMDVFTGTPCSYLKPFINRIIEHDKINFYPSTNEGDAVAFASGVWLGGGKSVVVFQNSGLGNAVNPLTSLNQISKIPLLGIVTLRGEPGGAPDEPQHELMGQITTDLLDLMKIPWSYFPEEKSDLDSALKKAMEIMESQRVPYFFVMKKDTVQEYKLSTKPIVQHHQALAVIADHVNDQVPLPNRTQALEIIHHTLPNEVGVIATTGKTGRELYEIKDAPQNFYMVGSMGCALSLGQGLITTSNRPVCVVDGDGALMMRMGSLATSGILEKRPLLHILLDNGVHDSTGGQATGSEKINFAQIAQACGYESIHRTNNSESLAKLIKQYLDKPQLTFIHLNIGKGSPEKLGRPKVHPSEVSLRFQKHCRG